MAYSTTNPPALAFPGYGTWRLWVYRSTDAPAVVRVANYITNGWQLGMRAGDLVICVDTDAAPITMQLMIVTTATSAGVNLSDGLAVTATNTD